MTMPLFAQFTNAEGGGDIRVRADHITCIWHDTRRNYKGEKSVYIEVRSMGAMAISGTVAEAMEVLARTWQQQRNRARKPVEPINTNEKNHA